MEIKKNTFIKKPEDGLSEAEEAIFTALEDWNIPFEGIRHEHADTMEACIAIEEVLQAPVCKNLFLCNRQETEFYLLMMPRQKPFKTKFLSAQIGCSRLSFAGAEKMKELLHTIPGSVSFLELLFDEQNKVRLIVDEDILTGEYICAHPGLSVSTLKLKKESFFTFLQHVGHVMTEVTLPASMEE